MESFAELNKRLPPLGIEARTVHPIASRYKFCGTLAINIRSVVTHTVPT